MNVGVIGGAQCLPVDDIEVMEVLQREKELRAIEATTFFIEFLFALEVMEELSPIDESRRAYQNREV
jgi:hypothetical protein